jgi:hypothetical protein
MQSTLLQEGEIVWAHIVQANQQMFLPGEVDCGAVVVFSPDGYFDAHPEELEHIAGELYDMKGKRTEPELQKFADILQNELIRPMRLVIPPSIAGDREVIYTDVMIRRKDLPTGRLSRSFMPLLIAPSRTQATLLLPWEWWSPALVALWRS